MTAAPWQIFGNEPPMAPLGQSRQFRHVRDWSARPHRMVARRAVSSGPCLNRDPLNLIEHDGIRCAVVELGRPRTLMCRHSLGILERAAGLEVSGNAGRPEHVAPELDPEAR